MPCRLSERRSVPRPSARRQYALRPSARRQSALRHQTGAALVVALLVFAIATALIVAMLGEHDLYRTRMGNGQLQAQLQAYLRGAEDLAALALLRDYDEDRAAQRDRDDLAEIWAEKPPPYTLDDGGWMQGSLEDLQGRFNLNSLRSSGSGQQSLGGRPDPTTLTVSQKHFVRMLQGLQEPPVSRQEALQITRAIIDWLDEDSNPLPGGAEDDRYYGSRPAYRAANRPMSSPSELRAVAGVTPELYRALAPLVTVWPEEPGLLNIHTALPGVLRGLNRDNTMEPLSESDLEMLLQRRAGSGFTDMESFLEAFGVEEGTGELQQLLGESSKVFMLSAEAEVAGRRARLYSVLLRENRQVTALLRSSGGL